MAVRLHTPTPTNVTWVPETVHIVLALVVAKTTDTPEAPPVALSVAADAPKTTDEVGVKPVMVCAAAVIVMLAVTCGAAL